MDSKSYITESGKKRYYSEVKAKRKYDAKSYDIVSVRLPKGMADQIKAKYGKPASTFMKEYAIAEMSK